MLVATTIHSRSCRGVGALSCFLWFHDWEKWSEQIKMEGTRHYTTTDRKCEFTKIVQIRKCKICNANKMRTVYGG